MPDSPTMAAVKQAALGSCNEPPFEAYLTIRDILYRYERVLPATAECKRVSEAVVAIRYSDGLEWPVLELETEPYADWLRQLLRTKSVSSKSLASKELERPGWIQLYQSLGSVLAFIIKTHSIFVSTTQTNIVQLCGPPLRPRLRVRRKSALMSPPPVLSRQTLLQAAFCPAAEERRPPCFDPITIFGSCSGSGSARAITAASPYIHRAGELWYSVFTAKHQLSGSKKHLQARLNHLLNRFAPPHRRTYVSAYAAGRLVAATLECIAGRELWDAPFDSLISTQLGPLASAAANNTQRLRASIQYPFPPLNLLSKPISWLFPSSNAAAHNAQQRLVKVLSDWLLVLALQIYLCIFHIEPGPAGKLLFYRHSVWRRLVQEQMDLFKARLRPVPESHDVPFKLKVIPKPGGGGARTIIVLGGLSQQLAPARLLLNQLAQNECPELLPDCASLAPRLAEYASRFGRKLQDTKFWMAKADISSCYDNIDLRMMQKILRPLSQRVLYHRRLAVFNSRRGRLVDRATRGNSYYSKYVGLVAEQRNPTPLRWPQIDKTFTSIVAGGIIVKFRGKPHVLEQGIPQGSAISMSLANLYMGALAKEYFAAQFADPKCLLLRYADDWLLITPLECQARDFAAQFSRGFPHYNLRGKPNKSVVSCEQLEFLGYSINSKTLQVRSTLAIKRGIAGAPNARIMASLFAKGPKALLSAFVREGQPLEPKYVRSVCLSLLRQIKRYVPYAHRSQVLSVVALRLSSVLQPALAQLVWQIFDPNARLKHRVQNQQVLPQ